MAKHGNREFQSGERRCRLCDTRGHVDRCQQWLERRGGGLCGQRAPGAPYPQAAQEGKNQKTVLSSKEVKLELDLDAKKFLVSKGTDLKYGARPLRRAIQKYVEDEIAEMILRNEVTAGKTIHGYIEDEKLKFKVG